MKKIICLLAALCLALTAAGCGSVFSAEYYFSEPYREEQSPSDGTETEVKNYNTLKNAILELVYAGESHGQFRFGSYEGSLIDDLAAVCLEIKTSTPIGTYAVEDISYDTSRIVSYYTADIEIEYTKTAAEIAAVVNVNGLADLKSHIFSVMNSYGSESVVKIYSYAADEEYIRSFVSESYYSDPFLMPAMPQVSVVAYPQSGPERIYVIDFRYAAMPERLREMDEQLYLRCEEIVDGFGGDDELSLALRCAMLLSGMAEESDGGEWADTAYGAIVEGSSAPMGLAMGYKALCDSLGIGCTVVRGERNSDGVSSHAWNIIELEGSYYHVDVSRFYTDAPSAFLISDEDMWGEYDWDRESYPVCAGELRPEDVFGPPAQNTGGAENPPPEEGEEPEPPAQSPEGGEPQPEPEPEPTPPDATEGVE